MRSAMLRLTALATLSCATLLATACGGDDPAATGPDAADGSETAAMCAAFTKELAEAALGVELDQPTLGITGCSWAAFDAAGDGHTASAQFSHLALTVEQFTEACAEIPMIEGFGHVACGQQNPGRFGGAFVSLYLDDRTQLNVQLQPGQLAALQTMTLAILANLGR